jgi:hypothetical protein
MNDTGDKRASAPYGKRYLHYILFFVLLAATFFLWRYLYILDHEQKRHVFENEAHHIVIELEDELFLYKILLNGGAGVFAASDHVYRREWRQYHKYQQTKAIFPHFQSLCYIPVVKRGQEILHTQAAWSQSFSRYEITPQGTRDDYAPVTFIEPLDSVNVLQLGNDYFSIPKRRLTMERARDAGDVAISAEIDIFNGVDVQPGFMMVTPVYTVGILPVTVEERRREISGFVAVNIRISDFAKNVVDKTTRVLNIKIFDNDTLIGNDPLVGLKPLFIHYGTGLDSTSIAVPMFTFEKVIDIYNHSWRIVIESTPQFESGLDRINQILVLVLGIIVSLLTLFLLNTLSRTAEKAKHLAETLTESLKMSEAKLRQITENISDVIFTTDQNLNTNYISPSIEKLTGYTVVEFLKLTLEQRHPKHTIENIKTLFMEEMAKESDPSCDKSRTRIVEVELFKIDGTIIHTAMHLSFIRDSNGQVVGIQGVTRDITEQKRAEKELYEKSSYLENLVNYANAPIIVWDPINIITRFNGAFEQLTGRDSSEVIGKNIELLFPDNSRENSVNLINLTKAGERWEGVEIEILCSNGTIKTLLWNSSNIYDQVDGKLNATIAQGFDITEVKQTNAHLLVAKDKAEESNRLKTAFINNISHEIRTPLNGIIGFGQLLNDCSLSVEERQSYYDMLKHSSDRLIQAIEDNLDIAQISSGTFVVNNTSFSIKLLMKEIIELAIGQPGRSANVEIVEDIPSGINNLSILTDRELLRKALKHLVSNAVKFTKNGTITIGVNLGEHSLEFYVRDTGKGIAPEKMEEIFRPYVQEVTDMTRGYEGSGLGLAIVKGIAGLLDGDVLAESEKRVGSTFYFTIPRRELSVKRGSAPFIHKEVFTPNTPLILIAEDDESSFLFQSVVVKRGGYNVLRATNGVEAVEFCRDNPQIDLVLMDIKMPILNGIEATEQIRVFRKDLPIIAVTAYAQSDDEFRILQSGCNDYLTKPIKSDTLLEKIRKFIT